MLVFDYLEWDDENIDHIAENGLTMNEVEDVLYSTEALPVPSRSTGRPAVIGVTATGARIIVVYDQHRDGRDVIIRLITAYEIEG